MGCRFVCLSLSVCYRNILTSDTSLKYCSNTRVCVCVCVCVACRQCWTVCDTTQRLTATSITIHTSYTSGPRLTDVLDWHDFAPCRQTADERREDCPRTNSDESGTTCQCITLLILLFNNIHCNAHLIYLSVVEVVT